MLVIQDTKQHVGAERRALSGCCFPADWVDGGLGGHQLNVGTGPKAQFFPNLEAARGIAALMVALFHIGQAYFFNSAGLQRTLIAPSVKTLEFTWSDQLFRILRQRPRRGCSFLRAQRLYANTRPSAGGRPRGHESNAFLYSPHLPNLSSGHHVNRHLRCAILFYRSFPDVA